MGALVVGTVFLLLGVAALATQVLSRGEAPAAPRNGSVPPGQHPAEPFDYQARPALAAEAELFYLRLKEVVAPHFGVWAGTPVTELVGFRETGDRARRPMLEDALAGLRTDFALVRAAEVVAVVLVDAPGRPPRRVAFQDAVLRQCGYRVLRFDPRTGVPKVGAMRDWLGPVLRS